MWLELYAWIESFVAVSFDPTDVLEVATTDLAFLDPFGWKSNMDIAIDDVMELLNTFEEHRQEAPDSLGDMNELKSDYSHQIIGEIIDKVNSVKTHLNLEINKIKGLDGLRSNISLISNLIEYCRENDMETAISSEKFEEFNKTNDGDVTNVLGIHISDMMGIYQAVSEICDMWSDEDDDINTDLNSI